MLINEEIVPFPHYLVVNQSNVYGFEWISKILNGLWMNGLVFMYLNFIRLSGRNTQNISCINVGLYEFNVQ